MKRNNIHPELNHLVKLLDSLARKFGSYDVFNDYLDMFINQLSFDYTMNNERFQSKYTLAERHIFGEMIFETIKILDKVLGHSKWFDVFGTLYENISLSDKRHFAQFFTPQPICDLMSSITDVSECKTINDPACGSGRTLMSAHSVNPKMFHVGIDLDFVCAKMSALNFALNGINGVVISDNGLFPKNNFRGAFIVNRNIILFNGVPQIEFINDVDFIYSYVNNKLNAINGVSANVELQLFDDVEPKINIHPKTNQILLF